MIAIVCAALTVGAGYSAGLKLAQIIPMFCVACLTNLGNYLKQHPIEDIADKPAPKTGGGTSA